MKWNDFQQLILFFTLILLPGLSIAGDIAWVNYPNSVTREKALIRGDSTRREIALIFSGGDFGDGGESIQTILRQRFVPASFFFTGDFYRNRSNSALIQKLIEDNHYLGPHSDQHLLYCDWKNRDSLLVDKETFVSDMRENYKSMAAFGIKPENATVILPPYEWYNENITAWAAGEGWCLINNTPGTLSAADYTTPEMNSYRSSEVIWQNILGFEKRAVSGMNGFFLLIHIGTHPDRTDKFYYRLDDLIEYFTAQGYRFSRIDQMTPVNLEINRLNNRQR